MTTETKITLIVLYSLDLFLAFLCIGVSISTGNISYAISAGIIIFLLSVGVFVIYREYVRDKK